MRVLPPGRQQGKRRGSKEPGASLGDASKSEAEAKANGSPQVRRTRENAQASTQPGQAGWAAHLHDFSQGSYGRASAMDGDSPRQNPGEG